MPPVARLCPGSDWTVQESSYQFAQKHKYPLMGICLMNFSVYFTYCTLQNNKSYEKSYYHITICICVSCF